VRLVILLTKAALIFQEPDFSVAQRMPCLRGAIDRFFGPNAIALNRPTAIRNTLI